ncbi:MAG: tetratricopeptide repeat protein, partial [candidate division WOR-3 bacterium]
HPRLHIKAERLLPSGLLLLSITLGQSFHNARALEQAGLLDAAWREYLSVVERNPADTLSFWALIRLSNRPAQADTLALISQNLEELFPDMAVFGLGRIAGLLGSGRRTEALVRARSFNRRWPQRTIDLAKILRQGGEVNAAIGYLNSFSAPDAASRHTAADLLFQLLDQTNQPVLATEQIATLVDLEPMLLPSYSDRLFAYGSRADPRRLVAALDRIQDPACRARAQASVLAGAGRETEAVRLLKRHLAKQELYQVGRDAETRAALHFALAIYQELGVHADRGRVLRQLNRPNEAIAALALDSGPAATFELAVLLQENANLEAAAAAYRRVLKRRPDDTPALLGLATVLLNLGSPDSAYQTIQRVRRDTDQTLLFKARLAFLRGQFDTCTEYVSTLSARFPSSFLVNDGLELTMLTLAGDRSTMLSQAMLDYETGHHQAARQKASQLARGDDPVAIQAYLLLARLLRQQRQAQQALALLDSALARSLSRQFKPRLQLEQADIWRDDLNNLTRYRQTLEDLILNFPATPYAAIARSLLAAANRPVEPGIAR